MQHGQSFLAHCKEPTVFNRHCGLDGILDECWILFSLVLRQLIEVRRELLRVAYFGKMAHFKSSNDRPLCPVDIIESDRDSCYRRDSKGFFLILKRHSHAICLFDMRPCLEDIGHVDLVVLKSS